ncbi:MAG TPA: DUF308 domain-containing protein [Myxococcaceae bacterium]|nr:DUF308 domain-containing protein [Myxococcaceae bacterium]
MAEMMRENPVREPLRSSAWGVPFVLGLILLALGIGAAVFSSLTGIASTLLFGTVLVIAGVLEVIGSLRDRLRHPSLLLLLGGIFTTLVGLFFVFRPLMGMGLLTLLLGAYFVVAGLFSTITSIMDRYAGWAFDFAYGLVALALGIMVFRSLPVGSLIWLGLFVGVEIAARGLTLMVASLEGRRLYRSRAIV